jgi:hypothetical protein
VGLACPPPIPRRRRRSRVFVISICCPIRESPPSRRAHALPLAIRARTASGCGPLGLWLSPTGAWNGGQMRSLQCRPVCSGSFQTQRTPRKFELLLELGTLFRVYRARALIALGTLLISRGVVENGVSQFHHRCCRPGCGGVSSASGVGNAERTAEREDAVHHRAGALGLQSLGPLLVATRFPCGSAVLRGSALRPSSLGLAPSALAALVMERASRPLFPAARPAIPPRRPARPATLPRRAAHASCVRR